MITLLSFMLLVGTAFGQGTSATLSGNVQDSSGGAMVGATITARNVDTGVETRATTNNAGIYNLVLQPGNYVVYADVSGFQRTERSGIRLTAGSQTNLPLPMAVAGQVTEIEVTGTVESMTLEASASTGTVLQEDVIAAIPQLHGNAIEATLGLMGGVGTLTGGQTWGASNQMVAGVTASMINVSRDGITVNEVRYPTGIAGASNINPEVVGEMRVVLSPVDAELGRGAGQIQVSTRSGSNAFRGSAVWNVQNTALDATDFSYKVNGTTPNWRNLNNYTLSASGPIIKNKTFFFFSWEQQIARDKQQQTPRVFTECARRGIYRWLTTPSNPALENSGLTGWLPNMISTTNSYNFSQGNLRSVDDDGKPFRGGEVINSATNSAVTIPQTTVQFESVFGQLRPDVRASLADPNNPNGVYGDWINACTGMDTLGYDPMRGNFLTVDSPNGSGTNGWASAYRYAYDPTGFADRFVRTGADYNAGRTIMPEANYFRGTTGDGLNTAAHRWVNTLIGSGSSIYGSGGDPDRRSITARIDHNINNDHRLSGTFNWESFLVMDAYRVWPEKYGGYNGEITRKPIGFTINLNSTLAPTLLNEFRLGLSQAKNWTRNPLNQSQHGDAMKDVLRVLADNNASNPYYAGSWAQDQLLIIGLGDGSASFQPDAGSSHPYGTRGMVAMNNGGHDPRWTVAENLTWIKGSHSFKAGLEYRRQSSYYSAVGTAPPTMSRGGAYTDVPMVRGGITAATNTRLHQSLSSAGFGVFNGVNHLYSGSRDTTTNRDGNYTIPYNMMTFFSGSLSDTALWFYNIPDANSPFGTGARWNKVEDGELEYAYTAGNQELSWFFKDDWKITPDLTLNLGVRWEYYGVPHVYGGTTLGMVGGSKSAWGITGNGEMYNNGKGWVVDRNYLSGFQKDASGNPILGVPVTRWEFIGPDSPNPDRSVWNKDMNNFAPHVGFAWQLPWFGKGLTTLRGGYSVSYSPVDIYNNFPGQFINFQAAVTTRIETFVGSGNTTDPNSSAYYMDLTDLKTLLPLQPSTSVAPLGTFQNDAFFGYSSTNPATLMAVGLDENLTNPYVHSLNMSLTRSLGRNFTLDVRYVGTFQRNTIASMNINSNSFLDTTHFNWIEELGKVRKGEESMYINSLIPHNGPAGTQRHLTAAANQTGSDQLRTGSLSVSTSTGNVTHNYAQNLARGNYNSIVANLGVEPGQFPRPTSTELGMVLRSGCLPSNRPGYEAAFINDNRVDVTQFPCEVGIPLNFTHNNPQFQTMNLRHNTNSVNNYNSMQAQLTMRPVHGLNFQATYTWSRNLGNNSWTNYLGERDYLLSGQHRSHVLRFFGAYELPFGPKGLLLRNASSPIKKAVEGWQLSWIMGMESGVPFDVTGTSTLWGRSWPILVRSDLWDEKQGQVRMEWGPKGEFQPGTYLERDYVWVLDKNICNSDKMTPTLYTAQCVNAAGTLLGPRALALAERNSAGQLVSVKYGPGGKMGDDGVMYNEGDDVIVFRNADQNEGVNATGNYKPGRMTGPGIFSLDMAMSKSLEFMEGKRFEIRVDAQNILNHASASSNTGMSSGGRYTQILGPSLGISSAGNNAFGSFTNRVGHRTFQARLRLSF